MSETHSSQEKRIAKAQKGKPYGGKVSERWTLLRRLARIVGSVFLLTAVFALSLALGAGIAIVMEFLLGWPDT